MAKERGRVKEKEEREREKKESRILLFPLALVNNYGCQPRTSKEDSTVPTNSHVVIADMRRDISRFLLLFRI